MEDYYKKRAQEYEEFYQRNGPVRQQELQSIENTLKQTLKNRIVLEIACGTGHWTQVLSKTAQSIVATDIAPEMLELAKRKHYSCDVSFFEEDIYHMSFRNGSFDGGLANFWFSHIPRNKIASFLYDFHGVLKRGSKVFFADTVYVPGLGGELIVKNGDENTYKLRKLKDGSEHLVLKNYFPIDELIEIFSRYDDGFSRNNIFHGAYFWHAIYVLK